MYKQSEIPSKLTIGQIAERIGQPLRRTQFAQRSRGIKPAGKVGNLFFFDESQVPAIRKAVKSLRPQKAGVA